MQQIARLEAELGIGALGSALNGVLPELVHTFAASSPDVRIDIRQMDTADQLASLQDRRLDIGFIRSAPATRAGNPMLHSVRVVRAAPAVPHE